MIFSFKYLSVIGRKYFFVFRINPTVMQEGVETLEPTHSVFQETCFVEKHGGFIDRNSIREH